MIYLQLFYEFFKTGLFAIGGGNTRRPSSTTSERPQGWYTQAQR